MEQLCILSRITYFPSFSELIFSMKPKFITPLMRKLFKGRITPKYSISSNEEKYSLNDFFEISQKNFQRGSKNKDELLSETKLTRVSKKIWNLSQRFSCFRFHFIKLALFFPKSLTLIGSNGLQSFQTEASHLNVKLLSNTSLLVLIS